MKEDVQFVLFGQTSPDFKLSVLNTTTNVNKWSKVKPVGNDRYGLYVYKQAMATDLQTMYANADNWKWVAPDNSAAWPYKLVSFFDGYFHGATIIVSINASPTQYFIEDTDMVFVQAQFNSDLRCVNIADFLPFLAPATNLYFGVVILTPNNTWTIVRNPNPLGVDAQTTSTEFGKWYRGLYLTADELPTLTGITSTIYPVVTAEYNADIRKHSGDISVNGITLPVSPIQVTSVTVASYISGALNGITITKSANAYYATFTYVGTNSCDHTYTYPAQTATFYICARVVDQSSPTGWQVLCSFSQSINSFTLTGNNSVNRTITQLWSSQLYNELTIACADTSINDLKVCLYMPNNVGNTQLYDVVVTPTVSYIEITTYSDPVSIADNPVQWGITAYWTNGDTTTPSSSDVTWESSNTSIATVDAYGYVTGIAAGQVTITARYQGKSDSMTVHVRLVVTGLSLSTHNMSVEADGAAQALTAVLTPPGATLQYVRWSVNNNNVKLYTDSTCTTEVPTGTGEWVFVECDYTVDPGATLQIYWESSDMSPFYLDSLKIETTD